MSVADRILASFERLVKAFTPRINAAYVWRYSVDSVSDTTFSGRRLSPICPFDDMPNIPLMPGVAGTLVKPFVGSVVGVAFLDGDPAQPFVVSWDQTPGQHVALRVAGTPTLTVDIAATGVSVYDAANLPPAQAVALAPAVTTFASAAGTAAIGEVAGFTAIAAGFTALAAFGPIAADTPTASACTAAATGATSAATADTTFASTAAGLIGTFPTGFTSTKTTTQ